MLPLDVGLKEVFLALLVFTAFVMSQLTAFVVADEIRDWRRRRGAA